MPDVLQTFRQKAEEWAGALNRAGGVRAMLDGLRQQMAEADRRRAIGQIKTELRRLERQANEMVLAVGVQAVGLHKAGRLNAPELAPLCQHVSDLETALTEQKAELAKLEAEAEAAKAAAKATQPQPTSAGGAAYCAACGKPLPGGSVYCPGCGAAVPSSAPVAPTADGVTPVATLTPQGTTRTPSTVAGSAIGPASSQTAPAQPSALPPTPAPAPQGPFCPSCGSALRQGARFCARCGRVLA